MKIIAYFALTLLSIVIQFCVTVLIQEKLDEKPSDLNGTSPKKHFNDILKGITQKPHALFYRTQISKPTEKKNITTSTKMYSNSTLPEMLLSTSTDLSSSIFDVLYEDNTTDTEETTTESLYTTTEFDNITEITLFDKKNDTIYKPKTPPKKTVTKQCYCNLLYRVCDINCCCDYDCTEAERKLFVHCIDDTSKNDQSHHLCYSHESFYSKIDRSNTDNLFCVAKTNLPEKRNIKRDKHDASIMNHYFKWQSRNKVEAIEELMPKPYSYGGLMWILRNGSVYYVDLPSTQMNNYCRGRKPVKFLKEETVRCNVKLTDLEIFHILSTLDESPLISVTETFQNNSTLNCSTLHCTRWTTVVCDEATCMIYNKSLHEPLCTENVCTNLALKVDYIFYYQESKIINATVKLFTQKVSPNIPFLTQQINVNFYMANTSIDQIIEYSGNPGYISGLPVIVSFIKSNFTQDFYKNTSRKTYLSYPTNKNGICLFSNVTDNVVLFGSNKRIKCRYVHSTILHNDTDVCNSIQNKISKLLGLNKTTVVSPYGNPQELSDKDWVSMQTDVLGGQVYGKFNKQKSELYCHNLITRVSLIFTFADTSEKITKRENKILSANLDVTARNITFSVEDISTIITIDTIFIDETKPSVYEYAGGPHLNIHLPNDFFFPFPLSESYTNQCNKLLVIICVMFLCFCILQIK